LWARGQQRKPQSCRCVCPQGLCRARVRAAGAAVVEQALEDLVSWRHEKGLCAFAAAPDERPLLSLHAFLATLRGGAPPEWDVERRELVEASWRALCA
jgi:hypothetical protein